jgi:phenylalanyl-tRNA synthetase beta chain
MGALVRGVKVGPSPEWLQKALETLGQRSINNIVDATNYVMLNTGQPVHAFDHDKIEAKDGVRTIRVVPARDGEQITLLGGETRQLSPRNLVIRDMTSGTALDIAGIKGGTAAELTDETTDIVVDCANFNYVSVRKTSRELKLATDASLRFQNEPSPHLAAIAMRDVLALIQDIAGGELVGVSDTFTVPPTRAPVSATLSEVNTLLGTSMGTEDIEKILVRFEYEFSRDGDRFTVTPPWERADLNITSDLIEEIGRVYGYNNMQGVLPPRNDKPAINKRVAKLVQCLNVKMSTCPWH